MTAPETNPTSSAVGQLLRTPEEVARVLNSLVARAEPVFSDLGGGKLVFHTKLRYVDPGRAFIIVEPSADAESNAVLLARPRVNFHSEPGGWRVEFTAADPKQTAPNEGAPGIRLRFPEIVAGHRRRAEERAQPPTHPLRCIADAAGWMPFEGSLVNVSRGGVGFLQYDPEISLEPGTVLKGCRIERPNGEAVVVDMEVRYSQMVTLEDGKQIQCSGCMFLNLTSEETARIEGLFGLKQA
jgi:c-di-GMP-binding flagellar brake protein YcgR